MAYFEGTTGYGSTGVKTITCVDNVTGLTFQPTWYEIKVNGPAVGGFRSYVQKSEGSWFLNGAVLCTSETGSGTNWQFRTRNSGFVIDHFSLSGGVFTQTILATHDSIIPTGFKVNLTSTSSTYDWDVRAGA